MSDEVLEFKLETTLPKLARALEGSETTYVQPRPVRQEQCRFRVGERYESWSRLYALAFGAALRDYRLSAA